HAASKIAAQRHNHVHCSRSACAAREENTIALTQTSTAVTYNGHSSVGELRRGIVCSPRSVGWHLPEPAARWQGLGYLHPVKADEAQKQHDALCRELEQAGAEIVALPASAELSLDAVYTHDATLATDFGVVPLRPGKPNRVIEAARQAELCRELGI